MANERVRAAIYEAGLSVDDVAGALGVDPKTVERWVQGNVPFRRNQHALAKLLKVDPGHLWAAATPERSRDLGMAELLGVWPVRSVVPATAWADLFAGAAAVIDILVFAGFWLSEDPTVRQILTEKARAGVRVRFLVGDPTGEAVQVRGAEEGIGPLIPAKIANVLHNFRLLATEPAAEFRLHDTTLYNSIYRGDDDMLVNLHLYGLPAHMAPLVHLRRVPGAGLFAAFTDVFERIWEGAALLDEKARAS